MTAAGDVKCVRSSWLLLDLQAAMEGADCSKGRHTRKGGGVDMSVLGRVFYHYFDVAVCDLRAKLRITHARELQERTFHIAEGPECEIIGVVSRWACCEGFF